MNLSWFCGRVRGYAIGRPSGTLGWRLWVLWPRDRLAPAERSATLFSICQIPGSSISAHDTGALSSMWRGSSCDRSTGFNSSRRESDAFYSRTGRMGINRTNIEPSAINLAGGDVVSRGCDQSIVHQPVLFSTAVLNSPVRQMGSRSGIWLSSTRRN
jgi:hypothetical protein